MMQGSVVKAVAATRQPLGLAEAKDHLRVDGTDSDALISGLIDASADHLEEVTGRAFLEASFDLTLDRFPPCILLPKGRVASVTWIKYRDAAGDQQTLDAADYRTDLASIPARIVPAWGLTWPTTRGEIADVTVRFVAGFGAYPAAVPPALRAAALLLLGHLYERREQTVVGGNVAELPTGVPALIAPHTLYSFG